MKTNKIISILLLFIVHLSFGQTNAAKEIQGQVFEESSFVAGVNIINNTTQITTISNEDGMFSLVVKEGDILVFSAVNLEGFRYRISNKDIVSGVLKIKMTAKEVELKEVIVNENAHINAENLGIIPHGQKKYTAAERKEATAASTPVDLLINSVSGRRAMLKKEVAVEKKEELFRKIEYFFDQDYYTDRLSIPEEHIKGFQLFCIEDAEFAVSLSNKNKTMCMFLITDLARKYLKIIENEK